MTRVLQMKVAIVFSDPDDVIESDSDVILSSRDEIIKDAESVVRRTVLQNVPFNKVCSLVTGHKVEDE